MEKNGLKTKLHYKSTKDNIKEQKIMLKGLWSYNRKKQKWYHSTTKKWYTKQ